MVDLSENSVFTPVTRIENNTVALGGDEVNTPNLQLKQLANRDKWLRDQIEAITGAGAINTLSLDVAQVAHGFSPKDPVYHNGANWVKSDSASLATAIAIGIVTAVPSSDTFTISVGRCVGLSGLVGGSTYFIQNGGGIGTTPGTIYAPVFQATSATTGWFVGNFKTLDEDLAAIAALAPSNGNFLYYQSGWTAQTPPSLTSRNRFVNGDFSVDQYILGSNIITAAAPKEYLTDMWYGYCTGGDVTGERITQGNNEYRYQLTGGTGNTRAEIGQRIEADYTAGLNGNTCSFSFLTESDTLTEIKYQINYPTTTKNVFGTKASPTVTSIASGTIAITSTEAKYDVQIEIPSAADTGIEVILFAEDFTSGTWVVGDLQFEKGTIATDFERKPYPAVLDDCKRSCRRVDCTLRVRASGASEVFGYGLTWQMRGTPVVAYMGGGTSEKVSTTTLTAHSREGGRFEIITSSAGDAYSLNFIYRLTSEL